MESHTETTAVRAPGETEDTETRPWVVHGVAAGLLGAAVIATFFLVVDILAGRPFWTPAALGSAVFLGEQLEPGAVPRPVIVAGYTVLHGVVFLSAGLMASFALVGARRRLGRVRGLLLTGALFVGLEVFFLAFVGLFAQSMLAAVGPARVAAANLLAAITMAALLLRPRFRERS